MNAPSNTSSEERRDAVPYAEKDKADASARVDGSNLKQRKRYQLGNTATIFASVSGRLCQY